MGFNRPLIFAHRGACKYAPENTIPAFEKAIAMGAYGVEIDVRLTRDKVPVVIHSDELEEHTTTYGFVHSTSLRALKTIDIGSHFDSSFHTERVPTLAEALEVLVKSDVVINIEIKSQPHWHFGLEERVVKLVQDMKIGERVIFTTFNPLILMKLRYLDSSIQRGLLVAPRSLLFLHTRFFGKFAGIEALNPAERIVTPELVTLAHNRNWKVFPWTVNRRSSIEEMIKMGVDGIITDDPLLVHDVIEQLENENNL